jgi:V8-like Glu-specific endopeptidase
MLATKIANPMTLEEVKKLPSVKATQQENFLQAGQQAEKKPEMEIIDGLSYPKGTEAIGIPYSSKLTDEDVTETDHFYPPFSDFDYTPRLEPKKFRRPKFIDRDTLNQSGALKTIFGADDRKVFYSTAYPWRCVGRVETPLGSGSGVMIGPRHVLTCSHVIDWQPNNTTGWIKFTPMYYNGSAPYGTAFGIKTYYKYKVTGPTIDSTEGQYDYTVIVLDRLIGNSTGWLGAKSYTDSWDGKPVWTHAGYPFDLTGTQRPTYQTGIALDGDAGTTDDHESMNHKADVYPGQSGGPFWGYWGGQPYAVATQSAQNTNNNMASGGANLLDLVNRARTEFP